MEATSHDNNFTLETEAIIKDIALGKGYKCPKLKVQSIFTNGANYLGNLYKIVVEEKGKEELHLFAKEANIPEKARNYVPANTLYKNEVFVYTTVAEAFNELQNKYHVPDDQRFQFVKYYGSNVNDLKETIVLENLVAKGYKVFDRMIPFDWEFAKNAIKQIAVFHALSFALKNENPDLFKTITATLNNPFNDQLKKHPDSLTIDMGILKDELRTPVENYINENKNNLFVKYIKTNSNSILIHSDYRASNILVKYQGATVTSLIPIDFQITSLGNPVIDLLYLLFTGSDAKFRKAHLNDYFEFYYRCLSIYLKQLSKDIDEIYPKFQFYTDLEENFAYGLDFALFMLKSILVETKDKVNIADMVSEEAAKEIFGNMKGSEIYKERVNEIVEDYGRWGFLKIKKYPTLIDSLRQEMNYITNVEKVIKIIAEKGGLMNFRIKVEPVPCKGANYVGDLFTAEVVQSNEEILNLFVKAANVPEKARKFINVSDLYEIEVFMYTTVANAFDKVQNLYRIPQGKRFLFPKYYGCNLNYLEEVIVLQNLATEDYQILSRFETINWEFAKIALEEIAKFHALLFAIKEKMPTLFDEMKRSLSSCPLKENMLKVADATRESVSIFSMSLVDHENSSRWENFLNENKQRFMQTQFKETENDIIIHGDYRTSNILVKYQDDKIVSLKPIDYQTAYYGNPVQDIIYLLFTGTDEEFRREYFDRYLDHYYDCLSASLKLLSLDSNYIYPRIRFYFDVKARLLLSGADAALFVLNVVLVEPGQEMKLADMTDRNAMNDVFANAKLSGQYKERFNGIVRDFVRWGLI